MCPKVGPSELSRITSDYESHKPCNILLAEDDMHMRLLLTVNLKKRGYSVIEAEDGFQLADLIQSEAVNEYNANPVEAIISDIRMPGPGTLKVLKELRKVDWVMPIFLITAFGDEVVHLEARKLGAYIFDKPFEVSHLMSRLMAAVPPRRPRTVA